MALGGLAVMAGLVIKKKRVFLFYSQNKKRKGLNLFEGSNKFE